MNMQNLLNLAKSKDVEIEIYKTTTSATSIDVLDNKVESIDSSQEHGLSIKVIKNHQLGFAYTTDFEEEILEETLEKAVLNSRYNSIDDNWELAASKEILPIITYNRELDALSIEDKIALALKTEEFAYKTDKRIKKTEKVSYMDFQAKIEIFNSNGVNLSYNTNSYGLMCDVIAEEKGSRESGSSIKFLKNLDANLSEKTGTEAAKKACELLCAEGIGPQKLPLILDPMVGAQIVGAMAALFSADSKQQGKSLLAGKLNQTIGSKILSIIDNGRLQNGLMSSPFDDEGIKTQETILVENGQLINFLCNIYTAKKEKKESTGNGRSASYKFLPDVAPSNLYIKEGKKDPKDIISNTKKGIYITRVMGMHTINPVSGDFSIGAAGIVIENGEKTYPVRGITIAGNLIELLESIEEIGTDLTFFPFSANFGSPTLLINNISVSG